MILLLDFEFCLLLLGVRRGPIGLVAALGFKYLDYQGVKSTMGPVMSSFDRCPLFSTLSEKLSWCSGMVFVVFPAQSSQNRLSEFLGRARKVARRKVMQIRGGITSGSALFDLFMPI